MRKLTEEEFCEIVEYIYRKTGIVLHEKKILIEGRLENYLVQNGYNTYHEFFDEVLNDVTGEKAVALVDRLTTNHTYFLREKSHFDFFKETILPEIKKKYAKEKDLRIWSAACSTGEEPYTIAMYISDFFSLEQDWDTTILATDISRRVLESAQKGIYLSEQVNVLPEVWQRRYTRKVDEMHNQISPLLRKNVEFRLFNLMNPFPFKKKFQCIFLRNVMIYFDEGTKQRLIDKIYDALEPGGYLIIGQTESLDRTKTKFKYVMPSVFKK